MRFETVLRNRWRSVAPVVWSAAIVCAAFATQGAAAPSATMSGRTVLEEIVPKPTRVVAGDGVFRIGQDTQIVVPRSGPTVAPIAAELSRRLTRATGYAFPVVRTGRPAPAGTIALLLGGSKALGPEGYELAISPAHVTLVADAGAGLFYGVQTLGQLLPAAAYGGPARSGPWKLPAATIRDVPRFRWRGAMLDVARHFFGVGDVEHLIDAMAAYKLNRLHLHLTDDQGWRIAIRARPRLTTRGAKTAVGGGRGGHFTQRDYRRLVAYARRRYVTVVPEIEMPGHATAALASYASLNCDGKAPPVFTGVGTPRNSLCVGKAATYAFLEDVVRELAAITPGPYIHIGGDEAVGTAPGAYRRFLERAQAIVARHGKRAIGWQEIAGSKLRATTVVQYWTRNHLPPDLQGAKVIMSPAEHAYLDQKYNPSTPLGTSWAGYVTVRAAYRWDPVSMLRGVRPRDVLGVEAPLWTETITSKADIDYMAFPRLIAIAEIGWSRRQGRTWADFRVRLGAQAERLAALGIAFYRSPEIPWR
jgi:hexosaminidase